MGTVILHFILERRFVMEEASKTSDISHSDLIDLYKHFWTVLLAELTFCHQYLNFYTGLLSVILGATLTGLLSIQFGDLHPLVLLPGPILIVVLAMNGYSTVQTFYRRFTQAWVTTINIESMLRIRHLPKETPINLGSKPVYKSYDESFIPRIEWPPIKKVLEEAKENGESAEKVTEKLEKIGTTLKNAKITFFAFGVIAGILWLSILLTTAISYLLNTKNTFFAFGVFAAILLVGILLTTAIPYYVQKELHPERTTSIMRWLVNWLKVRKNN
jgi:hypothetical protein